MAILTCKMCGGTLMVEPGTTVAECDSCGLQQTIPSADNEKKVALFNQADELRRKKYFDRAASVYELIVADFPEEAEAYWGLVLCEYGIEYVKDPATGENIPTCHRFSYDSVLADPNCQKALRCADVIARSQYERDANRLEEIRKGIVEVTSKKEPYDIFICYKETDETTKDRTKDSVEAYDVCEALTNKGYRVFFSRVTMEEHKGEAYEPIIFAALNSAKVMLVFGSKNEYVNAPWVRNEWSRYLKIMAKDKSRQMIPCYWGNPYEVLPAEIQDIQGTDMNRIGAKQDLVRGIEKILPREKPQAQQQPQVVQQVVQSGPNVQALLRRGFEALEFEEWDNAFSYFDKVLDMDAENGEAHVGQLLSELRLTHERELADLTDVTYWENRHYRLALRYGSDALRNRLEGYTEEMRAAIRRQAEREEQARRDAEEAERRRIEAAEAARREAEEADRKAKEEYRRLVEQASKAARSMVHAKGIYTAALRRDGGTYVTSSIHKDVTIWKNLRAVVCNSTGFYGLTQAGTVIFEKGVMLKKPWQQEIMTWRNVKKLIVGWPMEAVAAIMEDGSARLVGMKKKEDAVKLWRNVVDGAFCLDGFVGVRADGTVLSTGLGKKETAELSQWQNIVSVCGGFGSRVAGLRSDGTVVLSSAHSSYTTATAWTDVIQLVCGEFHVVGLKKDGTVVQAYEASAADWTDVVQLAAGKRHTLGLRSDGTVVAAGSNTVGQCNVSDWTNIIAVFAGDEHSVGLKVDGTLVATGKNNLGQCNVGYWKLFDNITDLAE